MVLGGSATNGGTFPTPTSSNARPAGGRRPTSGAASGGYMSCFRSIAGPPLRYKGLEREGRASKPKLVFRRQHLFWLPRAASALGVRLCQRAVDPCRAHSRTL